MAKVAHVRLELVNRAENVPFVRQACSGFAEAIGLSPVDRHDISTALTEACNNASLHAYEGAEGPLEVELRAAPGQVIVAVRDRGRGFAAAGRETGLPAQPGDEGVAGIGLTAIHGLASQVQLSERAGGGMEVAMVFATPSINAESLGRPQECFDRDVSARPQPPGAIELDAAPLGVAQAVLSRLLRAMAARAEFSIDQLGDLQRVGRLLFAKAAGWVSEGHVQANVAAGRESLELEIGPIRPGDMSSLAGALLEVQPIAAGSLSVQRDGHDERLILRLRRLSP